MPNSTPSLGSYLEAANAVYTRDNKTGEVIPGDLTPLRDAHGHMVVTPDWQLKNGLYAQAFIDRNHNVIVAFEGTVPGTNAYGRGSLGADAYIASGQRPPAFDGAVDFMRQVVNVAHANGIASNNIFVTGHSLGGAEAEYVAGKIPVIGGGMTFAAPGINTAGLNANAALTNYEAYGDPVANLGRDMPDGAVYSPNSVQHVGPVKMIGNPGQGRELRNVGQFYAGGRSVLNISVATTNVAGVAMGLVMAVESVAVAGKKQLPLHDLRGNYAADLGYRIDAQGNANEMHAPQAATKAPPPAPPMNAPPPMRMPRLGLLIK